ncbi:MAG: ROK family protein [Elusimicrobia bacterium]|nr:ROK family protein [Elusimicrobiota bacterium]
MSRPGYLALDIGGTKVAMGLGNSQGKFLAQETCPFRFPRGPQELLRTIREFLNRHSKHRPRAFGLGICGPVSPYTGFLYNPPNLPKSWHRRSLRAILQEGLRIPGRVDNDVNLAAWGEAWKGWGAQGIKSFMMVCPGTGLGGGLVLESQLIRGSHGFAAEIGHALVDPRGPKCGCGLKGCVEAYASGTGLAKLARRYIGQKLDGVELHRLALRGHRTAKKIFREAGKALAITCANAMNLLDVEAFIFGGSVTKSFSLWGPEFKRQFFARLISPVRPKILISKLGTQAGLLGALRLAIESSRSKVPACPAGRQGHE